MIFAERSIQNLENRLHRIFCHNQSYKYLNKLPSITKSINNTPSQHLGGFVPADVTKRKKDDKKSQDSMKFKSANPQTSKNKYYKLRLVIK
jgi:hypothetical protein